MIMNTLKHIKQTNAICLPICFYAVIYLQQYHLLTSERAMKMRVGNFTVKNR